MKKLELQYITVCELDLNPPYTVNELKAMTEDELMEHLYSIMDSKSHYRDVAIKVYNQLYFY